MKIEVCIDSVESAIEAEQGGASRVELCANLVEGGTTPSYGLIKRVIEKVKIPVMVMIRPRGGDFLYSDEEFQCMKEDIKICKQLGASGLVFGILKEDGLIDTARVRDLISIAVEQPQPIKSITFHRAFDMTANWEQAMQDIVNLNTLFHNVSTQVIKRILTSGMESSSLEGLDTLKLMVKKGEEHGILVCPGGGITEKNLKRILDGCKPQEFHVSGRISHDSKMKYRNKQVYMGGAFRPPEYENSRTDSKRIQNFVSLSDHK